MSRVDWLRQKSSSFHSPVVDKPLPPQTSKIATASRHLYSNAFLCENSYVRTTLELPDSLFREVKTRAVQQGMTLKDLLAQYIQAGMSSPIGEPPVAPRAPVPLPFFRKIDGPSIPSRTNAELYAILDEEDISNHHRVVAQSQPHP